MSIRPEGRIRVPCSAWRSVPGGLDAVVPLALTPRERRLTAAAALAVTASGLVAAAYVTLWCVGARPDELFLVLFLGVVGFAPVWAVAAAGLRLRQRLAGAWVDTRALPRPTFVLLAGAPLVLLNTAWEALALGRGAPGHLSGACHAGLRLHASTPMAAARRVALVAGGQALTERRAQA
jgi:hypothetical protein